MLEKERSQVEKLAKWYSVAVFLVIGILLAKLGWMQLVENEYYTSRADAQRTRLMTITAARGDISTSDGVVLVTDHSSYQVTVDYLAVRENGKYKEEVIVLLAELLEDETITAEKIMEICDANKGYLYKPIVIKKDLDIASVSRIEAHRELLPGVNIESVPDRTYMHGTLASHVLGYIGLVSQEELDSQAQAQDAGDENATNYKMGDYVGKVGVEKYYDEYLRGVNGYREVEVNAAGRPVSDTETVNPQNGDNLVLTIDYDLQLALETAMDETIARLQLQARSDKAGAGAGVLLDVNTGKVLAMVSRPDDNITQQNRAIQGRYVPGSTFKPVTAVAALESGVITDTEKIFNPGRYWEKPYIKTTAPIGYYNLYNGMALSDNVYFQELGNRAGIDNIAKYGKMLGLDGPTGIDLAYENKGARATEGLPTPEKRQLYQEKEVANQAALWDKKIAEAEERFAQELANAATEEEKAKIERRRRSTIAVYQSEKIINMNWHSEWHAADTFNVSIGQGRQNYTPLQLAVYASALANGGTVYQPYIVDKVVDNDGNVIMQNEPVIKQQADISAETIKKVREAMCRVTAPGGGAYGLFAQFPSEIRIAAKTGTAQPGRSGYIVGNKQYYDGLFICYAPADDPQVAFACVMEYGYSGSGSAGYVAKAVLEEYFALNP
ncbi:MAG: hypothetical protein IJF50_09420 [Peptococcaceae bacterium]|nr:hypothetical protein [Peptococcaceae bacterium]